MLHSRYSLVAFRACVLAACLAAVSACNVPEPVDSTVAAPTGLTATATDGSVTLTWTASSGANGYNVKRSTTNTGPYSQLASTASVTYTDGAVTNGTAYYYVVSAVDAAGESANSAQATATPAAPSTPPVTPSNVAATAGNAQVTLSWSASATATAYRVKRATTSGGPYTLVASPTGTGYVDTGLTNDTPYYYVVTAVNVAGESTNSAQVTAVPLVMNPPPTTFGTWMDVTPPAVNLTDPLCSNFGARSVQVDPAHPSTLYTAFDCQGVWRSTDFGATWTGPVSTGTNAALVNDCSGGLSIPPGSTAPVPTVYLSCIRGNGLGFWKSVDGGVNWTAHVVGPSGPRQDYSPPVIDPYDDEHLLMAGHEMDHVVESVDGGLTWTDVHLDAGMLQNGLSGTIFFINTGNASTTRATWLWMGQQAGGARGTWRTADAGTTWTRVDSNEVGSAQIYQPDTSGVIYMAGAHSALGWGVLRSRDYGKTWTHVGSTNNQAVVFGTTKNVYSMYGYPSGPGASVPIGFQVAAQPGTGMWVEPGTPAGLAQGPAQVVVVNDGTRNVAIGAMWNSGVWRYAEP